VKLRIYLINVREPTSAIARLLFISWECSLDAVSIMTTFTA
jgi:hypothetical protein